MALKTPAIRPRISDARRKKLSAEIVSRVELMRLRVSDKKLEDTDLVFEQFDKKRGLIAVDIDFDSDPVSDSYLVNLIDAFRPGKLVDEAWIIGQSFSLEARSKALPHRWLRLLTFQDFGIELTPKAGRNASKTATGSAIVANYASLAASILALSKLIDERISSLKAQRPNSREAISDRDEVIADLMKVKRSLAELRRTLGQFKREEIDEDDIVESTVSFTKTIEAWWAKGHDRILESGYNTGLFVTAISVCSLFGVRGGAVTLIAGALAGGKPLVETLKGFGKKLFS